MMKGSESKGKTPTQSSLLVPDDYDATEGSRLTDKRKNQKYSRPFKMPPMSEVANMYLREQTKTKKQRASDRAKSVEEKQTYLGRIAVSRPSVKINENDPSLRRELRKALQQNPELFSKGYPRQKHPQTASDVVDHSRQMFFLNYGLDVRKKEIGAIEEEILSRERELNEFEMLLESDENDFQEYLDDYEKRFVRIMHETEKESISKSNVASQVVIYKREIGKCEHNMSSIDSSLGELRKFQIFLNRISPDDWITEQYAVVKAREELQSSPVATTQPTEEKCRVRGSVVLGGGPTGRTLNISTRRNPPQSGRQMSSRNLQSGRSSTRRGEDKSARRPSAVARAARQAAKNEKPRSRGIKLFREKTQELLRKLKERAAAVVEEERQIAMDYKKALEGSPHAMKKMREDSDKNFAKKCEKVEELYFSSPDQVMKVLSEMEDENLQLMRVIDEIEETKERSLSAEVGKKEMLQKRVNLLNMQVDSLTEQLKGEQEKIANSEVHEFWGHSYENNKKELEFISHRLARICNTVNLEWDKYTWDSSTGSFEDRFAACLVSNPEKQDPLLLMELLEKQYALLDEAVYRIPADFIHARFVEKHKERRKQQREKHAEAEKLIQEERLRKARERAEAPIKKRTSKPVMARSKPPAPKVKREKKVKREDDDENNTEFTRDFFQ